MSSQRDSSPPATPFGRLPAWLRDGAWAAISGSEAKVLGAIALHVGGAGWSASPSNATLARVAGVSPRTARRALARLAGKELIAVTPGGGRHRANTCTLRLSPPPRGEANPATQTAVFPEKPGQIAPERGSDRARNAATWVAGEEREEREEKQQQERRRHPDRPAVAPAGDGGDAAVLLEELGVAAAIARQLVAQHGERRVREVAGWAAAKADAGSLEGTPAAYAVAALRGDYAEPAEVRGARAAETEAAARRRRDAAIIRRRASIKKTTAKRRSELASSLKAFRALPLADRAGALETARREMFSQPASVLPKWWKAIAWAHAAGRAAREISAAAAAEEAAA